jgi:hypothetical protein
MMTTSLLKDLLFISNPKVLGLSEYLNKTALLFIMPAFFIGIITEFFTNFDFKSVAKRAVIAFLAIKLLTPIHIEAVDTSLKVSSELIKKYSPQNKFLTAYQTAKGDTQDVGAITEKKGVWSKLTSIVKMLVNDPIVMIIFLLSYIAFFLLTQLYSLTYHLTIAMIGLCAVLSVLPITSRSLVGAVKSSLWCILMPFVVAIILCLIGDSDAFFKTYSGGIVQNLESLIQLFIMTIILLLAPMITSKIMSESGVSHVAESLGQMAAMTTLIGGASVVSKFVGAKSMAVGGMIHNSTSKPLMNKFKGSISNKAQAIAATNGIGKSIQAITANSPMEKMKHGFGDLKDTAKNTTLKEKMVLATDSVVNRKENSLANVARTKEAKSFNSVRPDFAQAKLPLSDYKKEAGNYLKSRDELINRPKLSSRYLETRRPHGIVPSLNAKDMIAGKSPTFTRVPIGGEINSKLRVPKKENYTGIRKGGRNDFRNV